MSISKKINKLRIYFSALLAVLCISTANANAVETSFHDNFSNATVKPEWTSPTTSLGINTAPSGQRFLGRAGSNDGLSNDTVVLTLSDVPVEGVAEVTFDVYVIRSMDGDEAFQFSGIGTTSGAFHLATSFSNLKIPIQPPQSSQSYPWPGSLPLTGTYRIGNLHYSLVNPSHFSDSTYRLRFRVPYTGDTLILRFRMSGLQEDITDESWGIDKVDVVIRD